MSHTEQKLGDVIRQFLSHVRLDDRMTSRRLEKIWPELLGKGVSKFTEEIYFSKGILHVQVTAASLRHELLSNKEAIIKRLNDALFKVVIKDLKIK